MIKPLLWLQMIVVVCFLNSATAQLYVPIDTIPHNKKDLRQHFAKGSKKLDSDFRNFSPLNKKYLKSFHQGREEMLEELFKGTKLLLDEELEGYLNGLIQNIIDKNSLTEAHRIFISRDTDPNAASLGDGNFIMNISLLSRLDNEEQLYFILGHELAHYRLEHLHKRIAESMKTMESKEYQQKKKEVKKSKYNRFTRSMEVYREMSYGTSKIRRLRELEADSLGFELVKGFLTYPENAVLALEKLDTISPSEIYKIDPAILKDHFSTSDMSFKESWTQGFDYSKYHYQRGKVNIFGYHRDSLSSHPELEERILKMKQMIKNSEEKTSPKYDTFERLKEKFVFESIYAHYCMEEYGRGIYFILQLQHIKEVTEREKLFYDHMLSLFYEKLAEARKNFTFKKYVDEVNKIHFSEEYNLFLTILDHLHYSELATMTAKYKTP